MTPARKTLLTLGGRGTRVRVLRDEVEERAVVQWYEHGRRRRKKFPLTREGIAEAKAFAEGFLESRKAPKQAEPISVRRLWELYTNSQDWAGLRDESQVNYAGRWAKWELFVGRHALADDTTLEDVDRFITERLADGMARNQVRQVINVARNVYNWGQRRELLNRNRFALFRWKQPKDAVPHEPAEYTEAEFLALLRELSPADGRRWRPWVALMLAGHHGQRANAVLHLRWEDVDWARGVIVWPARYQKQGKDFTQPITDDTLSALLTAQLWRERSGYAGPWVLFAGGGNRQLGPVVTAATSRQRPYSRQTTRSYRKERAPEQDAAWSYQAMWIALTKAEQRAKVEHQPYRALHGFRKMVVGQVIERSEDRMLGLEFVGDTDPKMLKHYDKRRQERVNRASQLVGGQAAPTAAAVTTEGERDGE